ncbi:hypothetical protein BBJ28_00014455 [Nothophytophthora sp. Chile5]|nr:hypothetical protein BBJ28_00014455 [Nothophytophthora sp. Chile5]
MASLSAATPVLLSPLHLVTPAGAVVVTLNGVPASPPTHEDSAKQRQRSRSGSFVPAQRMECVRVCKKLRRGGHSVFVVNVYLHRSTDRRRLSDCVYKPTAASTFSPEAMRDFMMAEREPDFVVEHRFSEFLQLHAQIGALLGPSNAHLKTCADCQDVLRVLLSRQRQTWAIKHAFLRSKARFGLLASFVNDLLTLTAGAGERTTSGSLAEEMVGVEGDCSVQEQVADLVQNFLKRSFQPSLGII